MAQQGEAQFVNEWLMIKHPEALQWKRVRLGPLPKKKLSKMYKVTQRWVDCVFLENDIVHLVEAKLTPKPGAVSQLELYRKLFGQTPEFSMLHGKQVKAILLTSRVAADVKELAKQHDIDYEVYQPQWLMDKLAKRKRG